MSDEWAILPLVAVVAFLEGLGPGVGASYSREVEPGGSEAEATKLELSPILACVLTPPRGLARLKRKPEEPLGESGAPA